MKLAKTIAELINQKIKLNCYAQNNKIIIYDKNAKIIDTEVQTNKLIFTITVEPKFNNIIVINGDTTNMKMFLLNQLIQEQLDTYTIANDDLNTNLLNEYALFGRVSFTNHDYKLHYNMQNNNNINPLIQKLVKHINMISKLRQKYNDTLTTELPWFFGLNQ